MREEILKIESFSQISEWRRAYTLGILSKPIWMTVASQQMRAAILAKCFIDQINENKDNLQRSDQRIKIAIIGGGIGGMTLAYCLHSYKPSNQNFKLEIDLYEKHDVLCPIQRGCYTRKIHPNFQFWPEPYEESLSIDYLKNHPIYSQITWEGNLTAAEIATRTSEIYFKNFETFKPSSINGKNILTIFQGCNYIKIKKDPSYYELTFTGNQIIDNIGNVEKSTKTKQKYESVFFATGFGIENDYIDKDSKDDTIIKPKPYWRNDNLGQPNLKDEPHRYIISGNGDGAVSDILRILIIDYNPGKLLETIKNSTVKSLISKSYNRKIKITGDNEDGITLFFEEFFKKLTEIKNKNDNKILDALNDLWNPIPNHPKWTISCSPFQLISEVLIWPRIKNNIEIICHFEKSNSIAEIIDNPKVTFYNKFLFFSIWAAGKIKTSSGNLIENCKKHHIYNDNILIRHGADFKTPINNALYGEILTEFKSGLEQKEKEKENYDYQIKYRMGKYIFDIEKIITYTHRRINKNLIRKINVKKIKISKKLTHKK